VPVSPLISDVIPAVSTFASFLPGEDIPMAVSTTSSFRSLAASALLLLSTSCSVLAETYIVNKIADNPIGLTPEMVTLETVTLKDSKVFLLLSYETGEPASLMVHPPKTKGAFAISDPKSGGTIELLQVLGIDLAPKTVYSSPRKPVTFTLVFPAFELRRFNLLEGTGTDGWKFSDIILTSERSGPSFEELKQERDSILERIEKRIPEQKALRKFELFAKAMVNHALRYGKMRAENVEDERATRQALWSLRQELPDLMTELDRFEKLCQGSSELKRRAYQAKVKQRQAIMAREELAARIRHMAQVKKEDAETNVLYRAFWELQQLEQAVRTAREYEREEARQKRKEATPKLIGGLKGKEIKVMFGTDKIRRLPVFCGSRAYHRLFGDKYVSCYTLQCDYGYFLRSAKWEVFHEIPQPNVLLDAVANGESLPVFSGAQIFFARSANEQVAAFKDRLKDKTISGYVLKLKGTIDVGYKRPHRTDDCELALTNAVFDSEPVFLRTADEAGTP